MITTNKNPKTPVRGIIGPLNTIVETLVPDLAIYFIETIEKDVKDYFQKMQNFLKIKKPVWIYSYNKKLMFFLLEQEYFFSPAMNILEDIQYDDYITHYLVLINKGSQEDKTILFQSDKKQQLLKNISENIFQDKQRLLQNTVVHLNIRKDKKISIIPADPSLRFLPPSIKKHLSSNYIEYAITPQEKFLLKQAFHDGYLNNYHPYLAQIRKMTHLLNFAFNQLEEESIFKNGKIIFFVQLIEINLLLIITPLIIFSMIKGKIFP